MPVVASSAYGAARAIFSLVRALLKDNDPNRVGTPAGVQSISRAANVVTVSLAAPLSLLAGDIVVVAGVTDPTYNGTFSVTVVLDSLTFKYNQGGANGSSSGGTAATLGLGAVYTDAVLLPYANSAYRHVQRKLANVGAETFKQDIAYVIVAAVSAPDPKTQVLISDATAPPNNLPIDLLQPSRLWERLAGSSEDFSEMTDMTGHDGLPSLRQDFTLRYWEWRGDSIAFLGALQDREVRIRYLKALPDLADASSTVLLRNAQEAVANATAALAANAAGSPGADRFAQAAEDAIEDLISQVTRRDQQTVRRRRPYSWRRGYGVY